MHRPCHVSLTNDKADYIEKVAKGTRENFPRLLPCESKNSVLPFSERKVFFSFSQRLLALRAEIFILGMAIRKRVALHQTGKSQTSDFITTRTDHERVRDGGSPGPKYIFLHNRHTCLSFLFQN
jgi:hypothetical protein